jgi:hypothetical protein
MTLWQASHQVAVNLALFGLSIAALPDFIDGACLTRRAD